MAASTWSYGNQFLDCCCAPGGCKLCLQSFCCPCYVWALIVDESGAQTIPYCAAYACAAGLPSLISSLTPYAGSVGLVPVTAMAAYATNKVRTKHGIQGSLCCDLTKSVFCEPCTLQQARTEQLRRYKPGDWAAATVLTAPVAAQMTLADGR